MGSERRLLNYSLTLGGDVIYLSLFYWVSLLPMLAYLILTIFVGSTFLLVRWYRDPGLRALFGNLPLTAFLAPISTAFVSWPALSKQDKESPKGLTLTEKVKLTVVMAIMVIFSATGQANRSVVDTAYMPVYEQSRDTLNRSLGLAAGSYASARAIDRVISMASEVQTGVGVASVKPLQFLKPIQDMAVRFSDIMVLAMASSGIQLLMLEFAKNAGIPLVGTLLLISMIFHLFWDNSFTKNLVRSSVSIFLLAKLAVPTAVFLVGLISASILDGPRKEAEQGINATTEMMMDVSEEEGQTDSEGFRAWALGMMSMAGDIVQSARSITDDTVERFVQLIVVYTLEAIILPIAMLWLMWTVFVKNMLPAARDIKEQYVRLETDVRDRS